jgi:hypothetical protein
MLAAGAVLLAKRVTSKEDPQAPKPARDDLPLAFFAFLMFLALFHWLGIGSSSGMAGGAQEGSYEGDMISSISEECFTGPAPF